MLSAKIGAAAWKTDAIRAATAGRSGVVRSPFRGYLRTQQSRRALSNSAARLRKSTRCCIPQGPQARSTGVIPDSFRRKAKNIFAVLLIGEQPHAATIRRGGLGRIPRTVAKLPDERREGMKSLLAPLAFFPAFADPVQLGEDLEDISAGLETHECVGDRRKQPYLVWWPTSCRVAVDREVPGDVLRERLEVLFQSGADSWQENTIASSLPYPESKL